jgi:uncharacterized membrane protein
MENTTPKTGLCILSFLIPFIGWILYFVKKDETPKIADAYGLWGIIGFVFNLVFFIAI